MKISRNALKNIIIGTMIAVFMLETTRVVYAAPGSWITNPNVGTINAAGNLNSTEFKLWDKKSLPREVCKVTPDGTDPETGATLWKVEGTGEEIPWLDATMGRLFAAPGKGIEKALAAGGISVQAIIFGKAAGTAGEAEIGGEKATGLKAYNLFQFSLEKGNPYGYIGAIVYAILRTIALLFLAVMVMYQLAKAGITVTGQDKSIMKESLYSGVVVLAMLFFMPNVIDLMVYIKNLSMVTVNDLMPNGASLDIVGTFWVQFLKYSGFANGLFYSMAVIFLVYLMFLYIGNAIALACLFAFFPFVAYMSLSDKSLVSGWFKQFVGTIMIPLIDGILLLVPAFLMSKASAGADSSFVLGLISFIACLFIVPARKAIREALGFGGAGWGEGAGLSAFKFAGAVAGTAVKKAAGGIKDAALEARDKNKQDRGEEKEAAENAELHDGLAKADHGIKNANTNTDGLKPSTQQESDKNNPADTDDFKGTIGANQGKGDDKGAEGKDDEALKDPNQNGLPDDSGLPGVAMGDTGSEANAGAEAPENDIETLQDPTGGVGADVARSASEQFDENSDAGATQTLEEAAGGIDQGAGAGDTYNNAEYLGDDADRFANLERADAAQEQKDVEYAHIDDLMNQRGQLEQEQEQAKNELDQAEVDRDTAKAEADQNYENQMAEIARANGGVVPDKDREALDSEREQAFIDADKSYNDRVRDINAGITERGDKIKDLAKEEAIHRNNANTLNAIQNNAMQREARYAAADKMAGGTGEKYGSAQEMAMRQHQNQIMRAHANHRNFDSKDMSGVLSNSEKAQFYRQRAQAHKHQVAKNNGVAAMKAANAVTGAAFSAAAQAGAGALMAMTGADNAMAAGQVANEVASSAWTTGTVVAAEVVDNAAMWKDATVREQRSLGAAEAKAVSARAFASKVASRERKIEAGKVTISNSDNFVTRNIARVGNVYQNAAMAATAIAHPKLSAQAFVSSAGTDHAGQITSKETLDVMVKNADKGVQNATIKVEDRREARNADYNPTLNISAPKESRPVKAYDPNAYKTIMAESREQRNPIKESADQLDQLQHEQNLLDDIDKRRGGAARSNGKPEKWLKDGKDDYDSFHHDGFGEGDDD